MRVTTGTERGRPMSGLVGQEGGVRVGAEVDVLTECVEALRALPARQRAEKRLTTIDT